VDSPDGAWDLEARLRELARLKEESLISEEEYEQKRAQVMRRL
jgi:hypothetical protein